MKTVPLTSLAPFASSDECRTALHAVHSTGALAFATDGHRLHYGPTDSLAGSYSLSGAPLPDVSGPPLDNFEARPGLQCELPNLFSLLGLQDQWVTARVGVHVDLANGRFRLWRASSATRDKKLVKCPRQWRDAVALDVGGVLPEFTPTPGAPALCLDYLIDAMRWTGATGCHFDDVLSPVHFGLPINPCSGAGAIVMPVKW
jgi:hypothetical protein